MITKGVAGEATGTGGDSIVTFVLNGTTAGRSLAAMIRWAGVGITIASITVSGAGNANMTPQASTKAGPAVSNSNQQMATLDLIVTGGNLTIDCTFTGGDPGGTAGLYVSEYAGLDTTGIFDAGAFGDGTTDNPSITITTVANNCHIISQQTNNSGEATAGANYTAIALAGLNFFEEGEEDTDFDAGAAGVKTVNYVRATTGWLVSAMSLKPAGAPAAPFIPIVGRGPGMVLAGNGGGLVS